MPSRSEDQTQSPFSVLSVRVSAEERALLEAASSGSCTTLSDFVRCKALEAAEMEILERNIVSIPAEHWGAFEAWIGRPARAVPALTTLARRPPTWDR